jgi:hypothetical protein
LVGKASELLKLLSTSGPTLQTFNMTLRDFKSDRLRYKDVKLSSEVLAIVEKADRIALNPQISEEDLNKVADVKP